MSIELNPIANPEKIGGFNTNFQLIEDELNENVLRRQGLSPGEANHMEVSLDMNSNSILNVSTDTSDPGSLLSLGDADTRFVFVSGDTMTGNLSMGGFGVTNLRTPTSSSEATRKDYVDSGLAGKVSKSGDSMSGDLNMVQNDINNIGTTRTGNLILNGVQVNPNELDESGVIWVKTLADLQALPTSGLVNGQGLKITTSGRAGDFVVRVGDFSTEVANDPESGVWAAFDDDPTGSSIAVMRVIGMSACLDWWGAVPGVDSPVAIQAAVDYCASNDLVIDYGASEYHSSEPIYVRENSHWRGYGGVLKNINDGANPLRAVTTIPGNMHPAFYDDMPHHPLDTPAKGDDTFTLTTAGDGSEFDVGEYVLVQSEAGYDGEGGHKRPLFAYLTQVTAYDGVTLGVADPILEPRSDLKASSIKRATTNDLFGNPLYICANASIEGVVLKSEKGGCIDRGGMYRCRFHLPDVYARDLAFINLLSYSTLEFINPVFWGKAADLAGNSYASSAIIVNPTYLKTPDSRDVSLFRIGEASHSCHVAVDGGDLDQFDYANAAFSIGDGYDCSITTRGHISLERMPSNAFTIVNFQKVPVQPVTRNPALNLGHVHFGADTQRAILCVNDGGELTGARIGAGVLMGGPFTTGQAIVLRGGSPSIAPSVFSESGKVAAFTGVTDAVVRGHFPGGYQDNSGSDSNIFDITPKDVTLQSGVVVSSDESSFIVTFDENFSTSDYSLSLDASFPTILYYSNKTSSGFTIEVDTPGTGQVSWSAHLNA